MIGVLVLVLLWVNESAASYGIDCSIWQRFDFTATVVSCLKSTKSAAFITIGAINRSGVGISVKPNPDVKAMTDRGWQAGMQVDVYIFLTKELNYYNQIAGPIDDLRRQGVRFNKLWIDIENDNHWSNNVATNVQGVRDCVRACRDKNVDCGIYSAKYFWNVAFAGVTEFKHLPLWYARWDKSPSFDKWATTDSFGGWAKPFGKQFTGDVSVCGCQVDENYSPHLGPGAIPFMTPELPCQISGQSGLCRSQSVCDERATSGNMNSQWTDDNASGCELVMASIKCCVLTPKPVQTAAPTNKPTPRPTSMPTPPPETPPPTTTAIMTTTMTTVTTLAPRILKIDDALIERGAIWFFRSIPPETVIDNAADSQLHDWQVNPALGYKTLDGWSLGATPIGYGDSVQYKTQLLARSTALWLRYTFDLTAKDKLMIQGLRLFVASDNSADVYINGKRVVNEASMGVDHEFQYWNIIGARIDPALLVVGKNLIAAYVVNPPKASMLSSDIYFDLELRIAGTAPFTEKTAMQTFPPIPTTRTVFYTSESSVAANRLALPQFLLLISIVLLRQ